MLKVYPFCIILDYKGKVYRMHVEQVQLNDVHDLFRVTAGSRTTDFITLRPHRRFAFGSQSNNYGVDPYWREKIKDYDAAKLVGEEIKKVIILHEADWINHLAGTGKGGI